MFGEPKLVYHGSQFQEHLSCLVLNPFQFVKIPSYVRGSEWDLESHTLPYEWSIIIIVAWCRSTCCTLTRKTQFLHLTSLVTNMSRRHCWLTLVNQQRVDKDLLRIPRCITCYSTALKLTCTLAAQFASLLRSRWISIVVTFTLNKRQVSLNTRNSAVGWF